MKVLDFALISVKAPPLLPRVFYDRCWVNVSCPSKKNTSNTNWQVKQKRKVRIDFIGLILFRFLTCLEISLKRTNFI